MRAYQLVEWQQPAVLRDVPVPDPGPGQVLLRVAAAGVCHSDLHIMEFAAGVVPWQPPFTVGHENAGRVAAMGAGVMGVDEGDAVAVYGAWGCGRCKACLTSAENACEHAAEIDHAAAGSAVTAPWPSSCSCPTPACSRRSATSIPWRPRRSPTPA